MEILFQSLAINYLDVLTSQSIFVRAGLYSGTLANGHLIHSVTLLLRHFILAQIKAQSAILVFTGDRVEVIVRVVRDLRPSEN